MSCVTVSVVIPAWNAEQYIAETVRSVLNQSFSDFEVIVVNDGSTDGTVEAVAALSDSRIRLFSLTNCGQSAASNFGCRQARGRFLKFLDADDCLNPEHLEAQIRSIRDFPDCVASCNWGYFRDDCTTVAARKEHVQRDYSNGLDWLVDCLEMDEGMMGAWLWLIPRDIWDRCGGWCEELSLNNDFDLSVRILLNSAGVRYAPDALYCYRKGVSGSLSGVYSRKGLQSALRTTQLGAANLLAAENSPRIRQICADRFQGWLFQFYPEHGDLVKAAEAAIAELGGSTKVPEGGTVQRLLTPVLGWKAVRRLQVFAEHLGWRRVQRWKNQRRLQRIS